MSPEGRIDPLINSPEYRCPHCDAVLDSVKCIQAVSMREAFLGQLGERVHHKLTPEFLAKVTEVYAEGGVPAIMERFKTGERNARRWLAEARNGD